MNPPDDTPSEFIGRMPILQYAAAVADIATFGLPRGQGAPLYYDYGVLPSAAMAANSYVPESSDNTSTKYQQRMDMVRHILGVVGRYVNSKSNGAY